MIGVAPRAAAHASLLDTDPAPGSVRAESPAQATLRFDESVSLPVNGAQLFDAAGRRLPVTATAVDAAVTVALPSNLSGTYVLAWRVVSADGHPVAGSLTFSVGQASPQLHAAPSAGTTERTVVLPLALAQIALYAGLLLTLGLGVFWGFVLPGPPAGRHLRDRIGALVPWTATAGAAGAVAGLPLTAIDQQGLSVDAILSASTWLTAAPSTLGAAAVVLTGLGLCVTAVRTSRVPRPVRPLLVIGVLLAALGPALTGHPRAVEPQWLMVTVDVLHVMTGGVWLGGLVALAITLPAARVRPAQAMAILARFSTLAAGVLALLVTSGTVLAWRILGSWENLFGTGYGRLLLAKIGLAAVAAGLAGWNRFVLLPRARSAGPQRRPVDGAAVEPGRIAIARVVRAEATVLALVLALTGFLVDQSPRIEAAPAKVRSTGVNAGRLGDGLVALAELVPARVGQSRLRVQLQDSAGEPVEPVRAPVVRIASTQVDLGEVDLTSEAAGTWSGPVVLPTTGQWRVQVSLRLSEFENPVTTLNLMVG